MSVRIIFKFNTAFFMDGSWLSVTQLRVLDFLALSLGLVSALRPAATQLQVHQPPQGLCTVKTVVLVLESILVFATSEAVVVYVMTK
ncbi:hypothetical protein WJX82_003893 [Trebouxia sp. C0006]